ncbi:hypothetical protein [Moorena producens]|uniref:hypothetical protein n=1 Tax=Moorena producens TaxID=1155739 RepID=UPI0009F4A536|nr:hypothetical protein [Moorena producens]
MANLIRQRKKHHYGLGGFHGAYKVRTQVPHTAPPHERLHQEHYQQYYFSKRSNVQIFILDMLPLLPITHYPLPITHYPLPITHYLLSITYYPS